MNPSVSDLKKSFIEQFGVNLLNQVIFRRIVLENEARRNFAELPELMKFLYVLYPIPSQDFEDRLNKFAERFLNGK